jgi:phenylpropionate dioxygenase-like ring-hydroxylating dioxygenase large terminal subunit
VSQQTAPPDGDDPIRNEWFPVAAVADVGPGTSHPFRLLGDRYLLVRGVDDAVLVVADTCPHRGAQLSLGSFDGSCLTCPYHGWQFNTAGECTHQPAQPDSEPPPNARLTPLATQTAYGLHWVCVGPEPRNVPVYPAWHRRPDRNVLFGPKVLAATGPRIVENFLDMAHFPFVHTDYLGAEPHTAVPPYRVEVVDGVLHARDCVFWQPLPGPVSSDGGSDVLYQYQVSTPYSTSLDKSPIGGAGGEDGFSILLVCSPEDETTNRVWMVTSAWGTEEPLESYEAFNQIIFGQDVAVVESQRPHRLPLDPHGELHQAADKMSLQYRRWLVDRGVRYGTSANT